MDFYLGATPDSDPAAEYEECRNKAAAVLTAIEAAASLNGEDNAW